MKTIYKIFILICFISCKAQTVIIPIENQNKNGVETITGTYFKDVNNLLTPFEGNWLFTNGSNTSLQIKLRKVVNYDNGSIFQDLLVGEYRYVENGVEKINTLNNFQTAFLKQFSHEIVGNIIKTKYEIPQCNNCSENEKRVLLILGDPLLNVAAYLTIRRIEVGGQEAISVYMVTDGIRYTGNSIDTYNTEFVGSTIPNGDYILIKQP